MDFTSIKGELSKFRTLVREKRFADADQLVRDLRRQGMTRSMFLDYTSKSDREQVLRWLVQKRRSVSVDRRAGLSGYNNPKYTHFVVVWPGWVGDKQNKQKFGAKIESGWEHRKYAKERSVEIQDVESEGTGPFQDHNATVVVRSTLSRFGLTPSNDKDWFP